MMYTLYISKVSYSICYFIYTIRLSLLTLLVHQYLIRMHIGHEIIAPVSLPLVLPTATASKQQRHVRVGGLKIEKSNGK